MNKSKIFVGLCIAFAIGILVASKVNISQPWLFGSMAVFVLVFVLSFPQKQFNKNIFALTALFLFILCLGTMRFQVAEKPNQYESLFNTKQEWEGKITSDIDVRTDHQQFSFRPKNFKQDLLVVTTKGTQYFYGDQVLVKGKIVQPKNFNEFDYEGFLQMQNVYAITRYPKAIILKNNQGNPLVYQLLRVKYAFIKKVQSVLAEPQGSLLLGILIGAKKSLPKNVLDNFTNTGTSHIIAISGYNISVIVTALALLAKYLGRKFSFWLSLLLILGFVVIAGASASVIRAAIMGGMLLLSFNIGRPYSVTPALSLAAAAMLLLNPKILYWDVGFQLSFLATMGIVYFMPVLEQLTEHWPNPVKLKSILLTTLSAIAATLPLILLQFGNLSLVAPLVNILILPIVPLTMLLGFLIIVPGVSAGFGFLANFLLIYVLKVTEFFAKLPYAALPVNISVWVAILLYLFIILVYLVLRFGFFRRYKFDSVVI